MDIVLSSGDEVDVPGRTLHSYRLFQIAVLEQAGFLFRHRGAEERERNAWLNEIQNATFGPPLAVLEAAAWRKRTLDRSH